MNQPLSRERTRVKLPLECAKSFINLLLQLSILMYPLSISRSSNPKGHQLVRLNSGCLVLYTGALSWGIVEGWRLIAVTAQT